MSHIFGSAVCEVSLAFSALVEHHFRTYIAYTIIPIYIFKIVILLDYVCKLLLLLYISTISPKTSLA